MSNLETKTAWEIYLDVCNHMSNAELIPKDKTHQFVTFEVAQKEIAQVETKAKELGEAYMKEINQLEVKVEAANKILGVLIEDMSHVPSRRLPIGKNSWLQEWSEIQEQLNQIKNALLIPRKEPQEQPTT